MTDEGEIFLGVKEIFSASYANVSRNTKSRIFQVLLSFTPRNLTHVNYV